MQAASAEQFPIYIEYLFVLFSLVSRVIATRAAGYSLLEEVLVGLGGLGLHLRFVLSVSSISLVRSNLGFLSTLALWTRTFCRGKILEHSSVICLDTESERIFLKRSFSELEVHSLSIISIIFWRIALIWEALA